MASVTTLPVEVGPGATDRGSTDSALDALVERLREADTGGEQDIWETADLTLAAVVDRLPKAVGHGLQNTATVLWEFSFTSQAARDVASEITNRLVAEGILIDGNDPKPKTLLTWAKTAQVWSREDRVPGASFYAHRALNSPKYDRIRVERLQRLVDKSSTGRISDKTVRNWIRDRKPGEKQSFLQKVERRLRGAVKSAASPWEATVQADRDKIAQILRVIANEIENGTFK